MNLEKHIWYVSLSQGSFIKEVNFLTPTETILTKVKNDAQIFHYESLALLTAFLFKGSVECINCGKIENCKQLS